MHKNKVDSILIRYAYAQFLFSYMYWIYFFFNVVRMTYRKYEILVLRRVGRYSVA